MRIVLAALLLTGCTTNMAEPPVAGESPGFACRGESLGSFTGQPATTALGAQMLRQTGARHLRWVAKGMMVTMDFRQDRLTVYLDGNNRVERASCG